MNKLAVGEIVGFSYRFLVGHIGTVLAITWLPAVLYAGADSAAHVYLSSHGTELGAGDMRAEGLYFLVSAAAFLVTVYARAAAGVGIVREIFGWRVQGGTHFPLDRTAWRMFLASIRFWLGSVALIALALGVAALGLLLAGVPLNATDQVRPTPAFGVAMLLAWGVLLYAFATMLRMGFLLPAVVVAEEKGGLIRSHGLTTGNFWRILALAVVLVLPTLVLLIAGESAVLGAAVAPDDAERDLFRLMARAEEAVDRQLVPWEIFNAVVFMLYSGLVYSGVARAYRGLTGTDHSQSVTVF